MSIYLDRHDLPGVSPIDVAKAHVLDVELQAKYDVKFMTYWYDESAHSVFCLVDAPSAEAAQTVHREAHGFVAGQVIEVEPRAVQQFLGKIMEPPLGEAWVATAFRVILFTDMESSTGLTQRLGDAGAMAVLRVHDTMVRDALAWSGGSEVKHTGDGIMASFVSVVGAVEAAIEMQRRLTAYREQNPDVPLRIRVGLGAGEPVTEHDDLFGAAVQLARRVCDYADPGGICVANVIRDLCIGKGFRFESRGEVALKGFEDLVPVHDLRW